MSTTNKEIEIQAKKLINRIAALRISNHTSVGVKKGLIRHVKNELKILENNYPVQVYKVKKLLK